MLSALGIPTQQLSGYRIRKRSIDARHRSVRVILTIDAYIDEPLSPEVPIQFEFPVLKPGAKKVVIVGAGPAGLFAALKLIQSGIQPIIIERGKDVRSRRRDLAALNKQGQVDPDSNYCFGEGGAGTYSDGKLYTRSQKRGDLERILARIGLRNARPRDLARLRDALAATKNLPGVTGDTTLDAQRNASKAAVVIAVKDGQFKFLETVAP